ncbi:MAG: hypothetical protein ABFR05_01530 [Bacteroidota bacterium]
MKKITIILTLIMSININAQKANQYEIKSGKIVYQHLKYKQSTKNVTDSEGNTTSERKDVPYVAKEVIYYWDDYGNKYLEEAYKISEFGGKPLPDKVKIYESLYKDGHRYYYGFEEYRFADDFIGNRGKWRQNPELVEKEGWYKVEYPKAEVSGKEKVCGKKATIYDKRFWIWKGLILKQVSYTTTPKGEIRGLDRSKEAIKMKKNVKFDKDKFNPSWLQEELLFQELDGNLIKELIASRKSKPITDGFEIKTGEKVIFKTSEGNFGKIVFTEVDEKDKDLKFIYMTYSPDNNVYSSGHNYGRPIGIGDEESLDMDHMVINTEKTQDKDFGVDFSESSKIIPQNKSEFYQVK